jgi:hypothetical protein
MNYYIDEATARADIVSIVSPIMRTAEVFIIERQPINVGLRDTVFAVRIKQGDAKSETLVNAIMNYQVESGKALVFDGSKLDMMGDVPNEYILVKVTINVLPAIDW